jgi:hypothetical protein
MAKSTITRPDGTIIQVDGSPEEIKKILELYSLNNHTRIAKSGKPQKSIKNNLGGDKMEEGDIVIEIVQEIRNGDYGDKIETNILDQSSQVDRVLLPLYIAKHINNEVRLTSGDIYSVLQQLGVKMSLPNISRTLAKTASKYIIPYGRRKLGQSTQYSLGLKGEKYIASILG